MSRRSRDGDPALAGEWRRLRRAALFFAACLLIFVVLAVVGLYH